MATHNEMFELVDAAVHAIFDSLTQGDKQGYQELWRKQSLGEHLKHADKHLLNSGWYTNNHDSRHIELQHALIRVAMALVIHNGETR